VGNPLGVNSPSARAVIGFRLSNISAKISRRISVKADTGSVKPGSTLLFTPIHTNGVPEVLCSCVFNTAVVNSLWNAGSGTGPYTTDVFLRSSAAASFTGSPLVTELTNRIGIRWNSPFR
jgi:hypothetical protein